MRLNWFEFELLYVKMICVGSVRPQPVCFIFQVYISRCSKAKIFSWFWKVVDVLCSELSISPSFFVLCLYLYQCNDVLFCTKSPCKKLSNSVSLYQLTVRIDLLYIFKMFFRLLEIYHKSFIASLLSGIYWDFKKKILENVANTQHLLQMCAV